MSLFLLSIADAQTSTASPTPPTALCSSWGQHHYKSFDGRVFTYNGKCSYALAVDCRPGFDDFAVHIENDPLCSGSAKCKRSVAIYVNEDVIRLSGSQVAMGDKIASLPLTRERIEISRIAEYTVVKLWLGEVTVKYDGQSGVYIHAQDKFKNNTCGICGNFNGDVKDDFMLPGDAGVTQSVNDFGNSWARPKRGQHCEKVSDKPKQLCRNASAMVKGLATMMCSDLKYRSKFSKCHSKVDPDPFYDMCMADVCGSEGDMSGACDILQEYSRQCIRHNVQMDWRNGTNCRK